MRDEKKKQIILGVLVAMVLGIGAWQFTSSGSTETEKKPEVQATEEKKEPPTENPEVLSAEKDPYMYGLKRKNPFQPYRLPMDTDNSANQTPQPKNPQPVVNRRPSGPRLTPQYGSSMPPYPIEAPGATPGPNTNAQINPSTPMRSPDEFAYRLSGVVDGPKPVAVFTSDSGHQKMVPINGSLEPGSRVVGIRDGKVVVSHKGKTITLRVGGNR